MGHPVVDLTLTSSAPAASLSVKVCDVFPDGTSALVTRGSVDLTFRDGVHAEPSPVPVDEQFTVRVTLDACAFEWRPGQRLRFSVAGSDWPNTLAPPEPVQLTVHAASLTLPLLAGDHPAPEFAPGDTRSSETTDGIGWSVTDDVLRRTTTAHTLWDSRYATPYDGSARECYRGEVGVDRLRSRSGPTPRPSSSSPGRASTSRCGRPCGSMSAPPHTTCASRRRQNSTAGDQPSYLGGTHPR